MKSWQRTVAISLALLVVCAIAGWVVVGPRISAYVDRHRTVEPDASLADQCGPSGIDVPTGAERIVLTADDGTRLGGATLGSPRARTAVVLRQGAGQRICQWLPYAARLAEEAGVRVVLFDRRGRGSSPAEENLSLEPGDTQTAADWARREGAERIVLVASSMGNSVMFAALPTMTPTPCGVVSISPVLTSGDQHGTVDGTSPSGFPDEVAAVSETALTGTIDLIAAAAQAEGVTVTRLALDTTDHSLQLITQHPEAQQFVIDAVARCA